MKALLAASLLVNVGVVAGSLFFRAAPGVGEAAHFGMGHEQVAEHLKLDQAQRARWHAMEADFVRELNASGQQIQEHRQRMVREILSERPDRALIEREREAIFGLQQLQQRQVVEQLLREREMLSPQQRQALADLLLAQTAGMQPSH
ncbi:MAG: Spy/CpxP family protein refolding chaperone [Pseudomonadota bacterium]